MRLTTNYRIHLPTVRDDELLAKSTGALDLQTKATDQPTICFALTVALHKKRKSHPRQWVDAFKSFLHESTQSKIWESPHGSVGMVQAHTVDLRQDENRNKVAEKQMNSSDLNDPHTAVWGISMCSASFVL